MLMGMIDESNRKYLKVNRIFYQNEPYKPRKMVNMTDRASNIKKSILLK